MQQTILNRAFSRIILACFIVIAPRAALAGLILQPASASSTQTQFGAPDNARNQSGLSFFYVSQATDFDTYLSLNPTHDSQTQSNRWTSTSLPASIDFALGGSFTISGIAFWDQGEGQGSTTAFTLLAADNAAFAGATTIGNFTATATGPVTAVAAQVYSFAPIQAQFVRFTATQSAGFDGATVGEVAFNLPEPSALLLIGFGAGAILLKRRQV